MYAHWLASSLTIEPLFSNINVPVKLVTQRDYSIQLSSKIWVVKWMRLNISSKNCCSKDSSGWGGCVRGIKQPFYARRLLHLKLAHLSGPGSSLSDNAVEFSHLMTLRLTIKQSSNWNKHFLGTILTFMKDLNMFFLVLVASRNY